MPQVVSGRHTSTQHANDRQTPTRVRIDKWLWAARFFKTRALASEALKGGKVSQDGQRVKPSKEIAIGDQLCIRQGHSDKTIIVLDLSDKRGPASTAQALYQETPESVEKRERDRLLRQAASGIRDHGEGRPTKRERRRIIRFTQKT